jgi:AraC-like DNA-binding protein
METSGFNFYIGVKIPAHITNLEGLSLLDEPTMLKIVFLNRGNAVLHDGNSTELLIAPVLVLLDNSGSLKVEVPQSGNTSGFVVFFHPCYINDSLTFDSLKDMSSFTGTATHDAQFFRHFISAEAGKEAAIRISDRIINPEPGLAQIAGQMIESMQKELLTQPDWYWPCRARSYLIQILIMIDQIATAKPYRPDDASISTSLPWIRTGESEGELKSLVSYLLGNYHHKITIPSLARSFNTNRTTIQLRFKKATGLSIAQYLIQLRVKVASILLRDTFLSVQEIMDRTGFEDPSHFNRMFRKYSPLSPTDYRAMTREASYMVYDSNKG